VLKKSVFVLILLILAFPVFAANPIVIKVASLAPQGSSWDLSLRQMAKEWNEITEGAVELKIYPNGIMGNEEDVIRKMRIGQVDAAIVTLMGMNQIVPDSFVLGLPFLIQTEDELDFVIEEVTPLFDDEFKKKGFVVLAWSKSGWIHIFSTKKVQNPTDLKDLKFGINSGQPEMIQAFKGMGFNIVSMGPSGLMLALQSGMVEAYYAPPMASASYQWFALAPHMTSIPLSPVLGGFIISERSWNRIPKKYHTELLASVNKVGQSFARETVKMNQQAMDVMLVNGLVVNDISPAVKKQWTSLFLIDDYSALVGEGKPISQAVYDDFIKRLEDYRRRKK
jgi:TRAP-type C4-dicarboxylate transport system substrate-binding protein